MNRLGQPEGNHESDFRSTPDYRRPRVKKPIEEELRVARWRAAGYDGDPPPLPPAASISNTCGVCGYGLGPDEARYHAACAPAAALFSFRSWPGSVMVPRLSVAEPDVGPIGTERHSRGLATRWRVG